MNQVFDAIVVGARCAGATLATRLAQAGYEVLLVDRSFFPSDVISTHTIFNNTAASLREIGVMDKLTQTDTPAIQQVRLQHDDVVIQGTMPPYQGELNSYCFRRTHFDKILLDHAREQEGVTALEGLRVTELVRDGQAVVGVRGRDREGNVIEFRAKIVIGADGMHSTVRREAGALRNMSTRSEYAVFYGYFDNVLHFDHIQFEINTNQEQRAYLFPTSDGRVTVVANPPLSNTKWIKSFKTAPEQTLRDYYAAYFPRAAERIADATLAEPMKGIVSYDNYWYQGMGAGWALVGDACSFKDPGLGQGIHDAVYGAKILCDVLKRHDSNDWQLYWTEMAQEYQEQMESEFMARFEVAVRLTKEAAHTEAELDMYRRIAEDDVAIEKYLGFYNYTAGLGDLQVALTRHRKEERQAVS